MHYAKAKPRSLTLRATYEAGAYRQKSVRLRSLYVQLNLAFLGKTLNFQPT